LRQAIRTAAHEYATDSSELTPLELFAFFVARCRKNLHIIIAFSPIGDAFRNHIRQYPSLINCCSIDWFDVRTAIIIYFPYLLITARKKGSVLALSVTFFVVCA